MTLENALRFGPIVFAGTCGSCDGDEVSDAINEICDAASGDCISIPDFCANLETELGSNMAGYSYVVLKDGLLYCDGAQGWSRTAVDGGEPAAVEARQELASLSKFITALGTLNSLEAAGVDLDDEIEPFLPSGWTLGRNLGGLTFRDLLTHRSGLRAETALVTYGVDNASLRSMLAAGVLASDVGVASYQNQNYALLRVLIPMVEGYEPGADFDAEVARWFVDSVNESVLVPATGVEQSCERQPDTDTLFYPQLPGGSPGMLWGDYSETCGSWGWHLSAIEYAQILANVDLNNGVVISEASFAELQGDFIGTQWWGSPQSLATTTHATARFHGGYLYNGATGAALVEDNSAFVRLDNGLSVVLFFNSPFTSASGIGGLSGGGAGVILRAWEDTW